MTADGRWEASANTPMGVQHFAMEFTTNGKTFVGTLSWTTRLTEPMELELAYSVRIGGDELTGEVKAGALGTTPLSGKRATRAATTEPVAEAAPARDLAADSTSIRRRCATSIVGNATNA